MRTVVRTLVIPLFILSGCASSTKVTSATTQATSGTSLVNTSVATSVATTATTSAATVPPTTTPTATGPSATVAPATAPSNLRKITLTVGKDSSPTRIEKVPIGADVQITMTNPTQADEFHLHGYDLKQEAPAGQAAVFSFVADIKGRFELESHHAKGVLLIIDVN